jgi:hypothetical protein
LEDSVSVIPKHKDGQPKKRKPPADVLTKPVELGGVEYALEDLASAVGRYVNRAESDGANTLHIYTGPSGSGFHPILLALEPSDTMDRIIEASERIATAFERIADAMSARPQEPK